MKKINLWLTILLIISQAGCLSKFSFMKAKKEEARETSVESSENIGEVKENISSVRGQIGFIQKISEISRQKHKVIQKNVETLKNKNTALEETVNLYRLTGEADKEKQTAQEFGKNQEDLNFYNLLAKYYKLNEEYEVLRLDFKKAQLKAGKIKLQKFLFQELNTAFAQPMDEFSDSENGKDKKLVVFEKDEKVMGGNPENSGESANVNKNSWQDANKSRNCQQLSAILGKNVCDIISKEDKIGQYFDKQMEDLNSKKKKLDSISAEMNETQIEIEKKGKKLVF